MRKFLLVLTLMALAGLSLAEAPASTSGKLELSAHDQLLMSYRRLLPLEGGSNFRDLGGYPTVDGRSVRRGLLFRSGAMTSLSDQDMEYLSQFGFQTVVDLRSAEELELFPNAWVKDADIDYLYHDYSIVELMKRAAERQSDSGDYSGMYRYMTDMLKPQLKLYFDALLDEQVPLVVNCSAGQDRTGVTSALLLSLLGVERELIIEDYLLSTDFRRPLNEGGDVDLEAAAETNAFAAMMLQYAKGKDVTRPTPLVTEDGIPFVAMTFEAIEARHGSVSKYLEDELEITAEKQNRLRELYLD